MVLSKKEQNRAFIVIVVLYGIWHTTSEWSKLLLPFLQWEESPNADSFQLGLLNAFGNGFVLIGSFVVGHLLDTVGTKFTAVVSCFLTGLYYMVCSQMRGLASFFMAAPLRIAFSLPQITEVFVASITDENDRTRVTMRLGIPLGAALVAGPWLGAKSVEWFDLRQSEMIAGVITVIVCLPLILFALPETSIASSRRARTVRLSDYKELLSNQTIRTTLMLRFMLDGPYQAYDYLSRQYIITQYLTEATDLAYLFVVVGVSTIFANTLLINWLQRLFRPRQLLQLALIFLAVSYVVIGLATSFYQMLVLMPLQVVGMSIAYAELSAQVTKTIEKQHYGKAIGLAQATQLIAASVTPIIGGYFVSEYDFSMWCNIAAVVSVLAVVLLQVVGGYVNIQTPKLPRDADR